MKAKRAKRENSIKSIWGKETLKFKVDKKNNFSEKAITYCQGNLCNEKAEKKEERNRAPKGHECSACWKEDFKSLRFKEETPSFDSEFLTRYDLR